MNHYTYNEIVIGQEESFNATITEDLMEKFYSITGDCNPLHRSDEYANNAGFEKRVVYGMLTASFLSTLAGVYLPGEYSLIHTTETEFVKPVRIDDELTIKGIVKEKDDNFQLIYLKVVITNQKGEKVCRAKMRIGLMK